MLALDGLARREDGEGVEALLRGGLERVLRLDAGELRRRARGVADAERVRGQRAQRRVRVVEELERLVARVRNRGRDLQVLDVGDVGGPYSKSALTKLCDAEVSSPATLSDTDWVADTASAERTMDASAALVEAENILASATGERAQEL